MPCYHVRMVWKLREQKYLNTDYELDLSEEEARLFGEQYEKGKVFFKSKWIDSPNIEEIEIRETLSKSTDYFPKSLDSSAIFYGEKKFQNVTRKFIRSPPKGTEDIYEKEGKIKGLPTKTLFIVHGRNDKPKLELARMLEKLGFNVTILSEQPDKGRTIIEKLEQETIDVGYVFVILTPDDIGRLAEMVRDNPREFKELGINGICNRARQNVILELGYFIGKIGRDRVCCLYKGDVELPSDIHGVLFKKFNESVEECYKGILEELKAAGYDVRI